MRDISVFVGVAARRDRGPARVARPAGGPGGRCVIEPLEGRTMFAAAAAAPVPAAGPAATPVGVAAAVSLAHPRVTSVTPAAGATKVSTTAFVSAELALPNGGVNTATLTASAVYLVRQSTGKHVPLQLNTSGGGDVIVLTPAAPLAPWAAYTFVVTAGLTDVKGATFAPYRSSFATGAAVATGLAGVKFGQAPQPTSAGRSYFGLAMGPDGRLYAGTDDGKVLRFPIKADGSLGTPTVLDAVAKANGGPRFVVGLAFDPASTAAAPILWVTHSATSALELGGTAGADWTGKVSRLSGAGLSTYHDAVVNLPRSVRDHITDQAVFGPDGALYFCQPSQSSMGRADPIWGNRPEHLLSASILRLDVKALGTTTLDARTPDGGGAYDPYAAGAALTLYATGVRNAFDLAWHRNGQLYAPGNGSAAGGNTPAGGGAVALTNVRQAETDYLFRVRPGGYYGHPNPRQGHFVLNGGNPTAGADPYEVSAYPVGTKPDPAWKPAAFDMGAHQSPDGVIEYKGKAFGGLLDGMLLVCRYSGGDDVVALKLTADGGVERQYTGIAGMTGLRDPVDLREDARTGCVYVSELGAGRITLLRPAPPTMAAAARAEPAAGPGTRASAGPAGVPRGPAALNLPSPGTTTNEPRPPRALRDSAPKEIAPAVVQAWWLAGERGSAGEASAAKAEASAGLADASALVDLWPSTPVRAALGGRVGKA